ncbi:MAG: hypothetical protein LBB58_04040 [Cellulomonadaceae bacterium]|jgi:hypothetical protein|nr:hypothetical protein [Cellulomonadaceae bacterium]
MSYSTNPNDSNYVAPGTVPPVVEAVEPAGSNLRWLWWLLGLLVLAGLIWALTRSCRGTECTAVPDTVWNQTSAAAVETVRGYANLGTEHDGAIGTALRALCNARLSHTGAGNWFDGGRIQNEFTAFAPNLEAGVLANIQNLVAGNTFCRCS